MKIYTKSGDDGTTGLVGGGRVSKSDPRIECFGTVDELNAALGLAAVNGTESLMSQLREIQADLFVIGSHLATPAGVPGAQTLPHLKEDIIRRLEVQIDKVESELPPLRNFILPGGSETAARLHLARTICRRAERAVVGCELNPADRPIVVRYLNRLSDWLFVKARAANQHAGVSDIPWIGR